MRRLTLAVLVLVGSSCAPPELSEVTQATEYPNELRGFVSTQYRPANTAGWDWNRCVPDPIGQLDRIRRRPDLVSYRMRPDYPPLIDTEYHWQGIVRLPTGDMRHFAVSSDHADGSYFATVQLETRNTTGHRLRGNRLSTSTPDWNVMPDPSDEIVRTNLVNASFVHPGGMQNLGRYLFVPLESGGGAARVFNYDVNDPSSSPIKLWGFVVSGLWASAAAIAKLADGRYLLITGDKDTESLKMYLSEPGLPIANPAVFGTWGDYEAAYVVEPFPISDFRRYYQNLNLLVGCQTGQLYLLGTTGGESVLSGQDWADLFELSIVPGADPAHPGTTHTVHMEKVSDAHMYCTAPNNGRHCDFDAAAGSYVDPDGRLFLYSTEHDNDIAEGLAVKMSEFRPIDHLDDPDTAAKINCSLTTAFVELYDGHITEWGPAHQHGIMIDYVDRNRRNYGNFDTAYSMNDKVQSIRYCIPSGYKYRLFSDTNHEPASAHIDDFIGDGKVHHENFPLIPQPPPDPPVPLYQWSSGCFMLAGGSTCVP